MGRLKSLDPMVGRLTPRVGYLERNHDRERDERLGYRAWYKTARWQRLRWQCLVRDLFTCRMCGVTEIDTSKLEADHKVWHKGDPVKFWDAENIQCLCRHCHASTKQRIEHRTGHEM